MKFVTLLFFFILLPSVMAADYTSPSTKFSMIVTFSETVVVTNAEILDSTNNVVTDMNITEMIPGRKFDMQTIYSVPRGDYTFVFTFRNQAGGISNIFTESRSISVAPSSIQNDFDIDLISPPIGFSTYPPPFTLTFRTTEPALCKYSLNAHNPVFQTNFDMDSSNSLTHTLSYDWIETKQKIYLFCQSTSYTGRQALNNFTIGYIFGENNFVSVIQEPEFVVDPVHRTANLIIETAQESLCYIQEQRNVFPSITEFAQNISNANNYKKINTFKLCFQDLCSDGLVLTGAGYVTDTEPHIYPLSITCRNLGQEEITIDSAAKMQLTYDANLQFLSPNDYMNKTSFPIRVKTDLELISCAYNLDNASGSLEKKPGNLYEKQVSISGEGKHKLTVTCTSFTGTITGSKEFLLDTKAPNPYSIKQEKSVCEGGALILNWSATDTGSGIKELRYDLYKGIEVIQSGNQITSGNINYNFVALQEYILKARIIDKAGNPTGVETINFNTLNNTDLKCDFETPRIKVYQKPTASGTNFWLSCRDNNECSNEFSYDLKPGINTNIVCSYNLTGELDTNITARISSVLCYEAEDEAGNIVIGKEVITVDANLDFCKNEILDGEESDIDCGGSCSRCANQLKCTINGDCQSGFCNPSGVCADDGSCWTDSQCKGDEYCDYYTGICKTEQAPNSTNRITEEINDDEGFNFIPLILIIIGITAIGSGAFIYLRPEVKIESSNISTTKPEMKISTPKKLDYQETKKVQELRNKLKTDSSKKRKSMLSTFDSKPHTDKDLPQIIKKTEPVKLEKKAVEENKQETKEKKVVELKTEYVDLTKKKKKDVFEELDDI